MGSSKAPRTLQWSSLSHVPISKPVTGVQGENILMGAEPVHIVVQCGQPRAWLTEGLCDDLYTGKDLASGIASFLMGPWTSDCLQAQVRGWDHSRLGVSIP